MRILFWVPYSSEGASNRYRVEQYLPYLDDAKISYALCPFWSSAAFKVLYKEGFYFKKIYFFILGSFFRFLDLFRIFKYDLIFIHREAYPIGGTFFESILSAFKKKMIFDFDDAIFLPSSSRQNMFAERLKNPKKIAKIIKMSSFVIAGNRYLADFALKYNSRVCVIPTAIDTKKYYPSDKKTQNKVIIGWIGSVTTSEFLNMLKNVFVRLGKDFPDTIFKIVGSRFYLEGCANIINKPWLLTDEIDDLMSFDIGIMPMPDNSWTRGKCGFKAILYMSMGIPCVCSPVGVNREIITDGVSGFLADQEEEWIEKLSLLISNPGLRENIGAAGRKVIEEKYSIEVNAKKIFEIIKKVYYLEERSEVKCAEYAEL